jgi:hypothetical protein
MLYSSNTRKVGETTREINKILKEIYLWFIENLKHPRPSTMGHPTVDRVASQDTSSTELTFELYAEANNKVDSDIELICQNACLHHHSASEAVGNIDNVRFGSGNLFICQCNLGLGAQTEGIHQDRLAGIRCELLSFLESSSFLDSSVYARS